MFSNLENLITQPILFLTLIIVWLAVFAWIINKIFDVMINHVISQTKTKVDDELAPILRKLLLSGLFISGLFIISLYADATNETHDLFKKLYFSGLILLISFTSIKVTQAIFFATHNKSSKNGTNHHTVLPFMNNIIKITIGITATLSILKLFSVDITPALASAGVIGVAVAFAAKDFVANLFGGISIFFDKTYLVGDYIIINDQYRGEVIEIGMRSTKIKTRDDIMLTVPNSVMMTSTVINETGFDPKLRIRIPVQVDYNSDLDKIEKILVDISANNKNILKNPKPRVRYRQFGESGINLELLVVIAHPAERGRVVHEMIKLINNDFKKHNVHVPYPHREIYMHKAT